MNRPYIDWRTRHSIPLVTEKVADLSDGERFPEIVRALDRARELREAGR